jgi:predicted nucleic-acid-binding Zn-ribbon protein
MNNEVRCPKCKSNQISANKKGFSGIRAIGNVDILGSNSNKIIITCLNCGHEFLPGQGYKEIEIPLNAEERAEKAAALDEKIKRLCDANQYLNAVKLYKDNTGVSVREAKDYIEKLIGQPIPTGSTAGNKGCAGAVLFFVAFVVIVVFILKG